MYAIEHNHFCQLNICQFPTQAKLPMLYGNIVQMLPFLNLFAKFFGLNTMSYILLEKQLAKSHLCNLFLNYNQWIHCKSFFSESIIFVTCFWIIINGSTANHSFPVIFCSSTIVQVRLNFWQSIEFSIPEFVKQEKIMQTGWGFLLGQVGDFLFQNIILKLA